MAAGADETTFLTLKRGGETAAVEKEQRLLGATEALLDGLAQNLREDGRLAAAALGGASHVHEPDEGH